MVARIVVNNSRVAISRPGVDVLTAPINTANMAFDSSFTNLERPLQVGVLLNTTINANPTVNFGVTYPHPPFVLLSRKFAGTNNYYHSPARGNGTNNWQNPYYLWTTTTYFQIRQAQALFTDPDCNVAFDWVYIVMSAT